MLYYIKLYHILYHITAGAWHPVEHDLHVDWRSEQTLIIVIYIIGIAFINSY